MSTESNRSSMFGGNRGHWETGMTMSACARALVCLLALAAGALLVPGPAQAEDWEGPTLLSSGTNWGKPRVAVSGDYVHVVWQDYGVSTLQYRRSTDGGDTWEPIVTMPTSGVVHNPAIAASGSYVNIVYRGSSHNIYLFRSTNNGTSFSAAILVGGGSAYEPDVAAAGPRVYVIWLTYYPTYDLYYTWSSDGENFESVVNLTNTSIEERCARIAAYNTSVYIAFTTRQTSNSTDYAMFLRSTNNGVNWWVPAVLWTATMPTFDAVAVAAHASNVYVDRDNAAPNGPAQKMSTNNGAAFGGSVWLGAGNDGQPEVSASAAYTANGCSAYTRGYNIYVSTGPGTETMIGTGDNPDIGANDDGDMHVVCELDDQIQYYRYVVGGSYDPGDLNCDGVINGFDIDHFVQVLEDWDAYVADHDGDPFPPCDPWLADINQDGHVNGFDIDPFVALLNG
ncbi:MAG: hypothetical protein KKB50_15870 [Planctomycetes bacterium]|nr:hypothetical protein [Planctomycetota bacterium]